MLLLHQQLSSNKPAGGTAALQPPASSSSSASAAAVAQGGQQLEAAHTAPPRAAISTPRHYQLASATTSLLTMAGEPFLTAADPVARQQLAHMTDFGLAYLAASHLIDAAGRPVGLAGLACHLFWTDPASLVLVRLLSSGAVHKVVQGVKAAGQGQQALHEALLLLVCGLFERMPLHPLEAKLWLGSRRHESSSVVSWAWGGVLSMRAVACGVLLFSRVAKQEVHTASSVSLLFGGQTQQLTAHVGLPGICVCVCIN